MNLSDYHLRMSFYKRFGFNNEAEALRAEWIASPGGMFMADLDLEPDWSHYDSFQKMLAASLLQNVAHSGDRGFTDSGLLALRVASALGGHADSINYYTGSHFYAVGSGNYERYWRRLADNKIFRPFIDMKNAQRLQETSPRAFRRELDRILRESPLFMPAIVQSWRLDIQLGREHEALRMLGRAMRQPDIPEAGMAYLLKMRGHTYYIFGRLDEADRDLEAAAEIAPMDAGIIGLRARVWATMGENLDEANRFAISLIKVFPGSVQNWNVLAMVVSATEGWEPALQILERVGRVAEESSELFMHLGDLRMRAGNRTGAAEAYRRAIALSDDGQIIRADAERRLRRATRR
jgi:tetratricopeptide (TPR) repeat protein